MFSVEANLRHGLRNYYDEVFFREINDLIQSHYEV